MDFKLTEMQQDIANLAKDFAEKKLAPTVKERDEKEVFDRAILDEMGTLGLLGIPWEEENGGVGADFLSLAVACEEVYRPELRSSHHALLLAYLEVRHGRTERKIFETSGRRHEARRFRLDRTQRRHGRPQRLLHGC